MTGPLDLAALMMRRFAHDLANPLAALHTLIELSDGDPLLMEALGELEARLVLFRALFGGMPDHPVPETVAATMTARLARLGIRLECDFATAPAREQRAGLALVLGVFELLVAGGTITVAAGPDVRIDGQCRPAPPVLVQVLAGQWHSDPQFVPPLWAVAACGPFDVEGGAVGLRFVPASASR
jgi:hypothetical protein